MKTLDQVGNLAAGIVGVALLTTIVSHPESAARVRALGAALAGSIREAMTDADALAPMPADMRYLYRLARHVARTEPAELTYGPLRPAGVVALAWEGSDELPELIDVEHPIPGHLIA